MTSDASPLRRWTTREQMRATGIRFLRRGGILIPFLALFLTLSLASEPFATKGNMLNILDQQSATLIIAAAGTLVLVAGGIDLSVGAIYGFAAATSANLALSHSAGFSILIGIGAGLLVGLANGVVITVLRINSLIATLAMAFIISGCSALMTGGNLIVLFNKTPFGDFARTHFLTVKTSIWVMVVAVVAIGLLLAKTTAGRYMYAAGGNAEAARLAGVRVDRIRILTFAISGTAAGLAGVIDTSNVLTAGGAQDYQQTLTFTVLAGIVVGGTSILGGEGAVWQTVVGVLFIALIGNGYVLLALDPLYEQITLGVLLLVAVGLDALARGLLRPGAAIKQLLRRRPRAP
jgi:ribose transport system permease protein